MADSLTKQLMERLGIRLPQVPEVTPEQEALHQEMVAREQAKWTGPRKAIAGGVDAAGDFLSGLNYFPIESIPEGKGKAYGAGALLASAPVFGPKSIKGLYSRVERIAESLPEMIHPSKLASIFKNRASAEEVKWRGLDTLIQEAGNKPLTRQAVIQRLQENPLDVKMIQRGTITGSPNYMDSSLDATRAQYDNYQLPGAAPGSYREDLIQLVKPNAKGINDSIDADELDAGMGTPEYGTNANNDFLSQHWDEPNIVVHTRQNERRLPPMQETGREFFTGPANQRMEARVTDETRPLLQEIMPEAWNMEKETEPVGPLGRMLENTQSDWEQHGAHGGYFDPNSEALNATPRQADDAANAAAEALNNRLETIGRHPDLGLDPAWKDGISVAEAAQNLTRTLRNRVFGNRHEESIWAPVADEIRQLQVTYDNALDATRRLHKEMVPNMPFKGMSVPPELALKVQLLDIAHNKPDTKWIGIAPSSELRARGEVISPEFQDKMQPRLIEKLFRQVAGPPVPAKNAMWVRPQMTDMGIKRERDFRWKPSSGAGHRGQISEMLPGGELQPVVSLLPTNDKIGAHAQLMQQLSDQIPNIQAPIAHLSPELLAQIREKGFDMLAIMAMLQAGTNNKSQLMPSHEKGK